MRLARGHRDSQPSLSDSLLKLANLRLLGRDLGPVVIDKVSKKFELEARLFRTRLLLLVDDNDFLLLLPCVSHLLKSIYCAP